MRVYNQCVKSTSLDAVYVATDDQRIQKHVTENGGKAIMTSTSHKSGTDRCLEAVTLLKEEVDYVINIQGDEPFISPDQIDQLVGICEGNVKIATLYKKIESQKELEDVNIPKVVLGERDRAIYFSRSPVPHCRGKEIEDWLTHENYYKHIGIYAYRKDVLATIAQMKTSKTERMEQLEQLRWLSNGIEMHAVETTIESMSVDTQEDLDAAIDFLDQF